MGRASLQQSGNAIIEVSNPQLSYVPGSIIQGVVKKVNVEDTKEIATVIIRLIGRIEAKTTEQVTESYSTTDTSQYGPISSVYSTTTYTSYIGKALLVDVRNQIYRGPVNLGIASWPFTIRIPQDGLRPIPPTLYCASQDISDRIRRNHLFTEYRLEAHIVRDGDAASNQPKPRKHSLFHYRSTQRPAIAIYPLWIRPKSTQQPVADLQICSLDFNETIRTMHLVPEFRDRHLPLRQQMRRVFKRSSIPVHSFLVAVEYPSIIQMEHPDHVPFRLRAVPKFDAAGQSTVLGEQPPVIKLIGLELSLRTKTDHQNLEGSHQVRSAVGPWQRIFWCYWNKGQCQLPTGLPIPNESNSHGDALDIGSLLKLSLTYWGVFAKGFNLVQTNGTLYPSFRSYHLTQKHQLKWKLKVECCGKKRKVVGRVPVTILGPSEDQEHAMTARLGEQGVIKAHFDWAAS